MSGFFPWNFRAGSAGGGISPEGCPLEDHPRWTLEAGTGPSTLCWADLSGKSVSVAGDETGPLNLAYNGNNFISGTIQARVAIVTTGDENWLLPLAGRMIDTDNLIGVRWNNGHYQVVQRVGGTWTTLFDAGTPALGDIVTFILSSQFWKLVVNGTQIGEGTTTLPDTAGFWGLSQHKAPTFIGHVLFHDLVVSDASLARTPCMTGFTSPYGEVSASSWWDESVQEYTPWEGMNCHANDARDCWVSGEALPMPQWIQWIGPVGQPAMIPDRLFVQARNIADGHKTLHEPKKMTLLGSNDGGQLWDEIQTWDDLDFGATDPITLQVNGTKAYMAVRLRIDEIRETTPELISTQLGTWTVYGHAGEAVQPVVLYSGAYTEREADAVYVTDLAQAGDSDDRAQLFSGTALQFDGVDDYVSTGIDLSDPQTQTICATVFFDGTQTGVVAGAAYSPTAPKGSLSIGFNNSSLLIVGVEDDNANDYFPPPPALENGVNRIVGVLEKSLGKVTVYVNGIEGGSLQDDNLISAVFVDPYEFLIGAGNNGFNEPFNGQISNVQIWDAAFTQEDIAFDFANPEKTADQRDGTSLTRANLKGYWPLCDGSGSIAHDWSDNASHGTLTAFPTDDSQWVHQQSSPLVPQTALMAWNYLDGVIRPIGQPDGVDFPRNFGELNWNGRSYANAGNGADVNPSTALIIEAIINPKQIGNDTYPIDKRNAYYLRDIDGSYIFGVFCEGIANKIEPLFDSSIEGFIHTVIVIDCGASVGYGYEDGLLTKTITVDGETIDATAYELIIGGFSQSSNLASFQMPLFIIHKDVDAQGIIDGDLDQWVADLYQKRVDQGFIPIPVTHNGEQVTYNNQPVYYRS